MYGHVCDCETVRAGWLTRADGGSVDSEREIMTHLRQVREELTVSILGK